MCHQNKARRDKFIYKNNAKNLVDSLVWHKPDI